MATVFLNGRFVEGDEARLSVFDASVQHGVGLFETMLGGVSDGKPWALGLEEHLSRLAGSARELGLSDRIRTEALAEAVLETLARCGLPRARVRLTVTGGDLNLLARAAPGGSPPPPLDPTVLIVAQPPTAYPEAFFEQGVSCVVGESRLNPLDPLAGHKTIHYWGRLRELQRAAAAQAGEALLLTISNHVAGGCVSNLFVVRESALVTPLARGEEPEGSPLRNPVLPGITREWVRRLAGTIGSGVVARMVAIEDVLKAEEAFLTNSSWGVLPVVRLERHTIGGGRVGPITRALIAAWREATGGR